MIKDYYLMSDDKLFFITEYNTVTKNKDKAYSNSLPLVQIQNRIWSGHNNKGFRVVHESEL